MRVVRLPRDASTHANLNIPRLKARVSTGLERRVVSPPGISTHANMPKPRLLGSGFDRSGMPGGFHYTMHRDVGTHANRNIPRPWLGLRPVLNVARLIPPGPGTYANLSIPRPIGSGFQQVLSAGGGGSLYNAPRRGHVRQPEHTTAYGSGFRQVLNAVGLVPPLPPLALARTPT